MQLDVFKVEFRLAGDASVGQVRSEQVAAESQGEAVTALKIKYDAPDVVFSVIHVSNVASGVYFPFGIFGRPVLAIAPAPEADKANISEANISEANPSECEAVELPVSKLRRAFACVRCALGFGKPQ